MPNSKAHFFYRSYCDKDLSGHIFSGDYANNTNVNDRNKLTYATTTGSADATSEDFIVDLGYEQDIDTIVLKSNLKTFTIYYWDGAAYQSWTSYASNTDSFLVISLTEKSTSKIKITATHTIVADEEKKIYMLELTKKITELYLQKAKLSEDHETERFSTIYGRSVQVVKYPNYSNFKMDLTFANLAGVSLTAYATMKAQRLSDSYGVYCYISDTVPLLGVDAYYLVNDISTYKSDPASTALSAGISGEMKLREA